MQKQEALTMLKEILTRQAATPNWVSFNEAEPGKYELTIKGNYDQQTINLIAQDKNLTIKENNGALSIY